MILSELGEQEDGFASGLEEYRGVMKMIRNTEGSVQPSEWIYFFWCLLTYYVKSHVEYHG